MHVAELDHVQLADVRSPRRTLRPPAARWPFFVGVFLFAALYTYSTGLIVFMADSYLFVDRAKHFVLAGDLQLTDLDSGLAYPPLYPLSICLAYLAGSAVAAHAWILVIHSALVMAQFWPFFHLLTGYARVPERAALWLAAALSVAPFTLPYASMVLSETLYFPLLLWLVYFFLRALETGAPRNFMFAGLFASGVLLTRSAAQSVLLAVMVAAAVQQWQVRRAHSWKCHGAFLLACGAPYGMWKAVEAVAAQYQSVGMNFLWERPLALLTDMSRLPLHAAWLVNTLLYPLLAPLSLVGCFVVALLFVRPRLLGRDPLVPLAALLLTLAALMPAIIMNDHWGGADLTWNRYAAPYVFLLVLLAIRYRRLYSPVTFRWACLLLFIVALAGRPAGLRCHFADSLLLFTTFDSALQIPAYASNLLYLGVVIGPAWLWLPGSFERRAAAILVTGCVWLAALLGAASHYRELPRHNVTHDGALARKAAQIAAANPSVPAYYDPAIGPSGYMSIYLARFWWPGFTYPKAATDISGASRVFYWTDKKLPGRDALLEDNDLLRLYELGPGLSLEWGEGVAGAETVRWKEQPLSVRWLGSATSFSVRNTGEAGEGAVTVPLGVLRASRQVQLEWNGATMPETHRIDRVAWLDGPQTATFRVRFAVGRNQGRLITSEPLEALPDGRRVGVLLAGEIAVTQGK